MNEIGACLGAIKLLGDTGEPSGEPLERPTILVLAFVLIPAHDHHIVLCQRHAALKPFAIPAPASNMMTTSPIIDELSGVHSPEAPSQPPPDMARPPNIMKAMGAMTTNARMQPQFGPSRPSSLAR